MSLVASVLRMLLVPYSAMLLGRRVSVRLNFVAGSRYILKSGTRLRVLKHRGLLRQVGMQNWILSRLVGRLFLQECMLRLPVSVLPMKVGSRLWGMRTMFLFYYT